MTPALAHQVPVSSSPTVRAFDSEDTHLIWALAPSLGSRALTSDIFSPSRVSATLSGTMAFRGPNACLIPRFPQTHHPHLIQALMSHPAILPAIFNASPSHLLHHQTHPLVLVHHGLPYLKQTQRNWRSNKILNRQKPTLPWLRKRSLLSCIVIPSIRSISSGTR
jgi:hypothetical protein